MTDKPNTDAPAAVLVVETPAELALRDMRAKRAAFEEARAAKLVESPEQALARETRDFADAEALALAQDAHGVDNVALVPTRYGGVVVKKPKKILHDWFSEQPKLKSADLLKYVTPCRLHPDAAAFDRIIDQQPQALIDCANTCARLAGVKSPEEAK